MNIEDTSTWLRSVELEIPRERVEEEEKKILKAFRQKVKVDGFRKGKVPEEIILRQHGKDIRAEAIDALLPGFFSKVLEEHKISPLAPPRIDNLHYGETGPLTVKATVEIMPEFEVKGYTGLKLEKTIREVEESDVDEALEGLQDRTAELVPVDRPAEFGDYLIADILECDETGTPIIGKRSENRTLIVEREGEGSEVGAQLVGIEKGGDRRVAVEHAANAHDPAGTGGGHKHVFMVQVKEVKEKRLPTLDDEYAKAVGDFEGMSDLRVKVREDLEEHVDNEARRVMVGQAIDALIKKNNIEVPESLIRRYLDGMVEDHRKAAGDQPLDEEAIRQQYRGMARMQMQWQLILLRIADQEELEVDEEDVRSRVALFAQNYRLDPEEAYRTLAAQGRLDRMRADLREEKVVDLILDSAKVKEKKVSPKKAAGKERTPEPSREESMLVGQQNDSSEAESSTVPEDDSSDGGSRLIIPGR